MNIGEASKASGVSAKMIRYYEGIGLIPAAERTSSGYRRYSPSDVHQLCFIRRARDLGFTAERISKLLELWRDRSRQSAEVKQLALDQAMRLRSKILELQDMVTTLESLVDCCAGDHRPDCAILWNLEASDLESVDKAVCPRSRGFVGRASGLGGRESESST